MNHERTLPALKKLGTTLMEETESIGELQSERNLMT